MSANRAAVLVMRLLIVAAGLMVLATLEGWR